MDQGLLYVINVDGRPRFIGVKAPRVLVEAVEVVEVHEAHNLTNN
jgi:hypothetical protein